MMNFIMIIKTIKMSNFLTVLKQQTLLNGKKEDRGWIIKYDHKDKIKEVKLLYNPEEYDGSRTILSDEQVIAKLTKEKLLKQ